jgi:hypothetical protein
MGGNSQSGPVKDGSCISERDHVLFDKRAEAIAPPTNPVPAALISEVLVRLAPYAATMHHFCSVVKYIVAETAARCMAVDPTVSGNIIITQSYAASQSYGLNPSPTIFAVSIRNCGNQVSADYTVFPAVATIGSYIIPALKLHAQACYPTAY